MALAIVQVYARTPYRIRAVFSGGDPTGQPANAFAITRQDLGPTTATVSRVIAVDQNSVDLVVSEALIKALIYVLTWSSTPTAFSFQPVLEQRPDIQLPSDDPEAEIFGVDLAWLSGAPTASGDCPRRSGRDCLTYDLPNRAALIPGELVQAQDAGGALDRIVNSTSSDAELISAGAKLEREFKRDPRVSDAEIDVNTTADGEVDFTGTITDVATGITSPVRSP